MEAQSLSVVVPLTKSGSNPGRCINRCKFCCAHMHADEYGNAMATSEWAKGDYLKRLIFASRAGVDSVVLTGSGEPLQNMSFVRQFFTWNNALLVSFQNIDIQTTGVLLTPESLRELRAAGVTTISLSVSDIFDDQNNANIIGMPAKLRFKLDKRCKEIKALGFNLRLSLNMLGHYVNRTTEEIFARCSQLGADQVTLRKMYSSGNGQPEDSWVESNSLGARDVSSLEAFVRAHGTLLGYLSFGAEKYSVQGMSVVVDNDCMSQEAKRVYRYLILQTDGRLYTRWGDKGSLVF